MNVTITGATLPTGFCALTNIQWQTLVGLLSGTIASEEGFISVGQNEPDVNNRDYPWLKLNSDGSPDKLYFYWNGLWLSRHALPPGAIIMSELDNTSIDTFDGGEAGAVTTISGPMWEVVTKLKGRSPMGAGTMSDGRTLSVAGQDTGTEIGHPTVTLDLTQIPAHSHGVTLNTDNGGTGFNCLMDNDCDGTDTDLISSASQGGGLEHNNLHPVYCVRFLRRTARLFYKA